MRRVRSFQCLQLYIYLCVFTDKNEKRVALPDPVEVVVRRRTAKTLEAVKLQEAGVEVDERGDLEEAAEEARPGQAQTVEDAAHCIQVSLR